MNGEKIRIGVDLMGGDFGPDISIPAVRDFIQLCHEVDLVLYGTKQTLLQVVHSSESVIGVETENDITNDRKFDTERALLRGLAQAKKSSIVQGVNALSDENIDVFITAGNTGAGVGYAKNKLSDGIHTPALSCWLPRVNMEDISEEVSDVLMMDVGAENDTSSLKLINNARLGIEYFRKSRGINSPKISLLNIGSEAYKGDDAYREAYATLNGEYSDSFLGNIEPDNLLTDVNPDIVIAGGMVGNIALKGLEGTFDTTTKLIKKAAFATRFQRLIRIGTGYKLKKTLKRFNPENRPDGILHGVKGRFVKLHGSASQKAFLNGLIRTYADMKQEKKTED